MEKRVASTEQLLPKEAQAWQDLADRVREAWRAGDYDEAGDLFLELQGRSTGWLLAIARRKAPADQAEELVARTHLALLEMLEADTATQNVKGLLGTILHRRIADGYRRRAGARETSADDAFWERQTEVVTDEVGTEEQTEGRETARSVANAILDALPALARDVLIARHLDGLTVAETAARLGMTEDQVKKRRQEAVIMARRIVEEQGLL